MSNRAHIAAAAFVAAFALLSTTPAQAADVTVTDAKIAGGKLVVAGRTAAPNTWVRLDGQTARDFNVKSGVDGAFAFGAVYHPGDCIVDLQRLISPTALGAATAALVADCGPAGVSPRGAWNAATAYIANDLVTYLGSTWRARRGNANTLPDSGAVWEQFAAAGEPRPEDSSGAESEAAEAADASPAADTPIGPAGGDLAGAYPNPSIKPLVITSGHLSAGAVTLTKLALNSVNTYRIEDGAVTSADVLDGSITGVDIANSSITGDDIASSSLTGIDIANGSLTSSDILDETIGTTKLADGGINTSDLAISSVTGSRIAASAVTSSDVANRTLTTDDMNLAERSGSIDVGAIANGRCATITGSVTGALPGDVAILSTNGSLPNGMLVYAQRALTDAIHIKVCNLTGATSAAITDLPVRVLSIH